MVKPFLSDGKPQWADPRMIPAKEEARLISLAVRNSNRTSGVIKPQSLISVAAHGSCDWVIAKPAFQQEPASWGSASPTRYV